MSTNITRDTFKDVWGDAALYAGMMAHVGSSQANEFLRDCLDGNGRLWRNPGACEAQRDYVNSCSRDMMMGALLGMHQKQIIDFSLYLKKNKGLLCPEASDNRNQIGVMGWAHLGMRLDSDATVKNMGLGGYLKYHVFKYFLGLVTLIEALTVYEAYQINLVYCSLMLQRMHRPSRWDKWTMKVLEKIRNCGDPVFSYLKGDYKAVQDDAVNAEFNRKRMISDNKYIEVAGWPPGCGSMLMGHAYPSEVYVEWLKAAVMTMRKELKFFK